MFKKEKVIYQKKTNGIGRERECSPTVHTEGSFTDAATPMDLSYGQASSDTASYAALFLGRRLAIWSLLSTFHMFGITDKQLMPSILLGVSLMLPSVHCWCFSFLPPIYFSSIHWGPRITLATPLVGGGQKSIQLFNCLLTVN